MAQSLLIELDLPKDWKHFNMPPALNDRLQELLDKQDEAGKLSRKERREAEALVKLAEVFSLMKVRAAVRSKRMSGSRIPPDLRRTVLQRARDCRLAQRWQEAEFHIDHIKPRCLGGPTSAANLALACV